MELSPGLLANNVIYCIIQVFLLATIIGVTSHSYIKYKQSQSNSSKFQKNGVLFAFGLLFNCAAFFCIFALFYKALVYIITMNDPTAKIPIFFACNLVFLQNTFLMMVLFIRIYYIFHTTALEISLKTIVMFVIAFIVSTVIFIILLTTKIKVPGTDSWVNCAVTLCVFNIIFAVWITALFLTKLTIVFKDAIKLGGNNSRRASGINEKDMALIRIITKTTLLSVISMVITFFSCLLLLFRFSLFGESIYISVISEWVIAIDVYSNFACYSLSFGYYEKYYLKSCSKLDKKCRNMFFMYLFGATEDTKMLMTDMVELGKSHNTTASMAKVHSVSPSGTAPTVTVTVGSSTNKSQLSATGSGAALSPNPSDDDNNASDINVSEQEQ